ncbi:hypothetical protein EA456_00425 [Streptococcus dysgalactiae subsp. dysgalactiae]|nr:hypothetical protein BBG09_02675 [Streptococcus dysgalactiae subsp. equisimilis]QET82759.1 hypothetical protein FOB62_05545 [Streptococcus dysgalactiae]QGG99103.1 hypothetical protein EA456_00425 [Streptococcus dysgalactiae subsp. dysgalactiae]BAH82608.1 phage protein [Streptococcus dysgalactiae subsp. equisimilis GGS_124]
MSNQMAVFNQFWAYQTFFQPTAQDIKLAILGYFTGTLWACEVSVLEDVELGYHVIVSYASCFDKSDRLLKIAKAVENNQLG